MCMFAAVFLLTACGKDDDKTVATASATTCQAGYGYSASYGCLPQGYCPTGYVTYNNSCVAATQQGNCPSGYVWNGTSCSVSGTTSGNGCPYPGTQPDPYRPNWCSCLPNLRPGNGGCY
jgi:hypothetical protein